MAENKDPKSSDAQKPRGRREIFTLREILSTAISSLVTIILSTLTVKKSSFTQAGSSNIATATWKPAQVALMNWTCSMHG